MLYGVGSTGEGGCRGVFWEKISGTIDNNYLNVMYYTTSFSISLGNLRISGVAGCLSAILCTWCRPNAINENNKELYKVATTTKLTERYKK